MNINTDMVQKAVSYIIGGALGGLIGLRIAEHFLDKGEEVVAEMIDIPVEETTPIEPEPEPKTEEVVVEPKEEPTTVSKKKKQQEPVQTTDYTKFRTSTVVAPNPRVEKARLSDLAAKYQAEETAPIDPNRPRIISLEEYAERDGRNKRTLTYYEADDTLADENEKPMPDIDNIVGADALLHFGTRSGDPLVVYVRNDALGCDFEVLRNRGSYKVEVAGMTEDEEITPKKSRGRKGKNDENEERD